MAVLGSFVPFVCSFTHNQSKRHSSAGKSRLEEMGTFGRISRIFEKHTFFSAILEINMTSCRIFSVRMYCLPGVLKIRSGVQRLSGVFLSFRDKPH